MAFIWKSELVAGVEIYHDHATISQITEIRTNFDNLVINCLCECSSYKDGEDIVHQGAHLYSDNPGHDSDDDNGFNTTENEALDTNNLGTAKSSELAGYNSSHLTGNEDTNNSSHYPGNEISHDGSDLGSNRTPYHSTYDADYQIGHDYCTSEISQQSICQDIPGCSPDILCPTY